VDLVRGIPHGFYIEGKGHYAKLWQNYSLKTLEKFRFSGYSTRKENIMVEWTDPRVLVAIYAAIISTVSLIWNIVNLVTNKKRKIKIEFRHNITFTKSAFGFSPVVATLSLNATNIGNENLHIKDFEINFCGKKIEMIGQMATAIACIDPSGAIKYPYPLQKGEVFRDDIGVISILDEIKNKL
jgi:hypothetical protein